MSKKPTSPRPERIATAKRDLIICLSWLAISPLILWLMVANKDNFWLAVIILLTGILPFTLIAPIWAEYQNAKKSIKTSH